jgi:hypothetical protein
MFPLRQGNPMDEHLTKVAKEKGILLMICDMCFLERNLVEGESCWFCLGKTAVFISISASFPLYPKQFYIYIKC